MATKVGRLLILAVLFGGLLAALPAPGAAAAGAMLRVVHASPDAPAVDIYLNGQKAIEGLKFTEATPYTTVPGGSYRVQVFPAGAGPSGRAVIDANVTVRDDMAYTIVAANRLSNIEALVLNDNLATPAAGKAHVRVVHAAPDAPAVDVAVAGGPTVFQNAAFKAATDFTPVDAGTYRFAVRPAGSQQAVLTTGPLTLEAGRIYSVFAVGLVSNNSLQAIVTSYNPQGGGVSGMPSTGGGGMSGAQTGGVANLALVSGLLGLLALVAASRRFAQAAGRR